MVELIDMGAPDIVIAIQYTLIEKTKENLDSDLLSRARIILKSGNSPNVPDKIKGEG